MVNNIIGWIVSWIISRIIIGVIVTCVGVFMLAGLAANKNSGRSYRDRPAEVSGGPNGLQDSWNEPSSPSTYRDASDYSSSSDYRRSDGYRSYDSYGSRRPGQPMMTAQPSR